MLDPEDITCDKISVSVIHMNKRRKKKNPRHKLITFFMIVSWCTEVKGKRCRISISTF